MSPETLPPYTTGSYEAPQTSDEKTDLTRRPPDTLHFLDHAKDNMTSLSLRYDVPIVALRKANNITSDHLLVARRTIIIPGEHYPSGISLSPRPVEGEGEERRRYLVRRFMVGSKVAE